MPAIQFGTVIDHVDVDQVSNVWRMLRLDEQKAPISLGVGIPSESMGTKAIIKVHERKLTTSETDQLALLCPRATINIIEDYEVISKTQVQMPSQIRGGLKCKNPSCITNIEETTARFTVLPGQVLQCHYCEKVQ